MTVDVLNADIRACRLCVDAGFIPSATPIATAEYEWASPVSLTAGCGRGRAMLIGQAPGSLEAVAREHFVGRAGRVLFRWLARIGVSEEAFRSHVYMTAVTKCFPGRAASGDRRPSAVEVRLCRPFLLRQLSLVDPALLLLVGKMAIDIYLPGRSLDDVVGRVFEVEGRDLVPLPHPSGMSRWLNAPANQDRLSRALELLRERLLLASLP